MPSMIERQSCYEKLRCSSRRKPQAMLTCICFVCFRLRSLRFCGSQNIHHRRHNQGRYFQLRFRHFSTRLRRSDVSRPSHQAVSLSTRFHRFKKTSHRVAASPLWLLVSLEEEVLCRIGLCWRLFLLSELPQALSTSVNTVKAK